MCRGTKPGPKRRKLSDGGRLQFWILPNGSRLWRIIYRFAGKQKILAVGTYPDVLLAEARERRDAARLCLRDGKYPAAEREEARRAEMERLGAEDSFGKVAQEFVAKCRRENLAEATLIKNEWLLDMAMPALRDMEVSDIRPLDVSKVLQEVEARGRYAKVRSGARMSLSGNWRM